MTAKEISKQFATNSDDEQALKNFIEQHANEKVNKALANKYSFEEIWNSKGFKESPVAKRIKEYQEIIRRTDKLIQEDGGGVMLAKFEVIAMEVLTNNSK